MAGIRKKRRAYIEEKDCVACGCCVKVCPMKAIKEENYIILDVRTHEEFAAGHIPGAMVIPNETIGTEDIPQLPHKDQLIMVYCRSGNRSKQASDKLVKLGYTNIVEFGGIIDWPGEIVTD